MQPLPPPHTHSNPGLLTLKPRPPYTQTQASLHSNPGFPYTLKPDPSHTQTQASPIYTQTQDYTQTSPPPILRFKLFWDSADNQKQFFQHVN